MFSERLNKTRSQSTFALAWFFSFLMVFSTSSVLAAADDDASSNQDLEVRTATTLRQNDGRRKLDLPPVPFSYSKPMIPDHIRPIMASFDNSPPDNPITDAGATLGRVLFYDKSLSANGMTACADCHRQDLAFTDDRRFSVGFDGQKVARNSMSLVNVRFYLNGKMFWDERAKTLEQQVLMPIENKIEMGHQLPKLVDQLRNDPIYDELFTNAFGDTLVTSDRIAKALAQFVRSIVSFGSRFDEGRAKVNDVLDPFPNFTDQENYGKEQFFGRANCASCHLEPVDQTGPNLANAPITGAARANATGQREGETEAVLGKRQAAFFYVSTATVNGIDSEDALDKGVADETGRASDAGRFKVPSLRNIELTGPYMHDGRFRTLDQVIEHYNWSIKPHPNLDERLEDFVTGLALPETEKVALTKFLLTLTDRQLLTDPKFSDPFVRVK